MACADKCWYRAAQVYQDIPSVHNVVSPLPTLPTPEGLGNMLWFIVMNAFTACAFMGLRAGGW